MTKTVLERIEEFKRKHPGKVDCDSVELGQLVENEKDGPLSCAWLGFQFGYMRGYNNAKRERSKSCLLEKPQT